MGSQQPRVDTSEDDELTLWLIRKAIEALECIHGLVDDYNRAAQLLRESGYHQIGELDFHPRGSVSYDYDRGAADKADRYPYWFGNPTQNRVNFLSIREICNLLGRGPISEADTLKRVIDIESRQNPRGPKKPKNFEVVERLGKSQSWVCFYCTAPGDNSHGPDGRVWHIEHIYPLVDGGDSKDDNLVLSCATCNLRKGRKLASDILAEVRGKVVVGNGA